MLRILTLNVNGGLDFTRRRFVLPALREAVLGVNADVVFLQEILGHHAGHARRHPQWPQQPQHEYLAHAFWPHHAYERNAMFPEGEQGNALLSRWPLRDIRNHDISIGGHESRGMLHAQLELAQTTAIHVICVHLGLLDGHRRYQLDLLSELIRTEIPRDAPLVVAGDFNDWRGRGHVVLQTAGLTEAYASLHGRLARTFPARRPLLPLDRIYVRHATACSAQVLCTRPWAQLSDHAALLADVALDEA
jgi:endonuclease/exonuclease/phosphatase family metal-dependent hydrolase